MKCHIQREHIPNWFSEDPDRGNDLPRLRALRSLCHVLTGCEDFQELVRMVNSPGVIPETFHIEEIFKFCMANV